MPEHCTGSGQPATGVKVSTIPRFFGQRFGTCGTCGGPVRVRKGTYLATPHTAKPKPGSAHDVHSRSCNIFNGLRCDCHAAGIDR